VWDSGLFAVALKLSFDTEAEASVSVLLRFSTAALFILISQDSDF